MIHLSSTITQPVSRSPAPFKSRSKTAIGFAVSGSAPVWYNETLTKKGKESRVEGWTFLAASNWKMILLWSGSRGFPEYQILVEMSLLRKSWWKPRADFASKKLIGVLVLIDHFNGFGLNSLSQIGPEFDAANTNGSKASRKSMFVNLAADVFDGGVALERKTSWIV